MSEVFKNVNKKLDPGFKFGQQSASTGNDVNMGGEGSSSSRSSSKVNSTAAQNASSSSNLFGGASSAPKNLSAFGALSLGRNDPSQSTQQSGQQSSNSNRSLFDRVERPPGSSASAAAPSLSSFAPLSGGNDPPQSTQQASGTSRSLLDRIQKPPGSSASTTAPSLSSFAPLSGGNDPPQSTKKANLDWGELLANIKPPPQGPTVFGQSISSLFGLGPSQTKTTSNMFASTTANNASTTGLPAASSLFGQSLQEGQNQAGPQGSTIGQGQDGTVAGKPSQIGIFDGLLEKGRKRQRENEGSHSFSELPSLQLNLSDIAKRARELGGSNLQGGRGADSSAHYLLAASGVNPGSTRRDLDDLATQQSFGGSVQQQAGFEPDTHKYLNQLQQQSTLKMISEGLDRAHRNFDQYLEESVDINWNLQRKKIYEHFGLTPRGVHGGDDLDGLGGKGAFGKSSRKSRLGKTTRNGESTMNRSIFGQSSIQKSVIGTPGKGSTNAALFADATEKNGTLPGALDGRFQREKQRKYIERVQALNQHRLQKFQNTQSSFSVLAEFQSLEDQPGGDSPKQLVDAYSALINIVGDENTKERHFADDYLDETPNSAKAIKIRKKIIDGSRASLEKAFYKQLENLVAKNPKEAQLGGIPTAFNKIKAYVNIRHSRKDLVPDGFDLFYAGGEYVWPILFFCLRCGLIKEAADFVTSNAVLFRTFDKNIITYLTNYATNSDRRLDRKLQILCNNVYTSISKADAMDPYRVACYKIIGRCDLIKRSLDNISQGVEDWTWLQFNLAREVNRAEENAGDVFGLEEVRETILEIGERHFAKGAEGVGGWGTFFHLQILAGMFERAISFLYSYSYMSAVHFAIALDYYGLLRVSDFGVSETELCKSRHVK